MASRHQKSKVKKTMTAGINCKNERSGDAGNDVDHATQQEAMMQSQSTEKAPGENFFHRLPIEIRQMVYGLAVVEEDAIYPVQVEARANKFHGGKTAAKVFTSLLLTCRRFYEELLSRPDFYRV
ncbi:hypothetical protein LZ32DRAFT_657003 [Colletotrichum eremochloae]|nr:hypothetical protein LZ32DRAFT_657003 [Colletotrichum eremochloae]